MKTDIYSHYLHNKKQLGFWIKKNHWDNYLARIVKFKGISEGEDIDKVQRPSVIAFLLDTRTNELEECVELSNPNDPSFIKVTRNIEPKNILPLKLAKMAARKY